VPEGTGEGAYLQMIVKELTEESEVMDAKAVCDKRAGKTSDRDFSKYSGDVPLRGYKASPVKIWMNDDELDTNGKYVKDIRIEVSIDALKSYFNLK